MGLIANNGPQDYHKKTNA